MISSQDGTEDRLPRAALRLWRVACSAVGSAGAEAVASAGDGAGAGGLAAVAGAGALAAAAGAAVAGESAAFEKATAAAS